jgi:hypothetical protein
VSPKATLAIRAALALTILASAPAHAQSTLLEITVQPGDTCESIAERLYGDDPDGVDVLHAHNPELGPLPHHLVAGTVLHAPPPAALTAVEHVVERRDPAAAAFDDARSGDALARGTQVRTHEASSAEITFHDRAVVTVRERTLVIVYGGRRRLVERSITHAELERGALRSRLAELAGEPSLQVETPTSEASLDGAGVVSVEEDGTSRLANHGRRGATIVADGERIVVPPDTGVVVRPGERPSRPRRLLAAPRWRSDRRGFVIGFADRGATITGGFEAVEGAARYRVEVARHADGSDVLAAVELEASVTEVRVPGIPDGTVYVSVASIDDAGLEGRRSPWRAFSVRLARLVSPGGTDASVLPDDAPRVLPGTWLVAPRGLTCGLEGETPSEIVTLAAVGRATVACTDGSGTSDATLDVDVVVPAIAITGALERDRSSELTITMTGDVVPPDDVVVVSVSDGARASRLHASPEGSLRAEVFAPIDAPDVLRVTLEIVAGAQRFPLASVELAVSDPPGTIDEVPVARPEPPPREERTVQGAFGDLAWPSMLALRDERRAGLGGWIYAAAIGADGDPQIRVGGGARAQVRGVPLRFALASQGDALGDVQPVDRRGHLDLLASVGGLLLDLELASLAIDLSAFLPTRREPESLGRVRLAPSIELSVRPTEWLTLRTRQGALVDVSGSGARLWAFAIGGDVTLVRWLAIGVELDGSIGTFASSDGAALAAAIGAELRLEGFELALGARVGLTDEARALAGEWSTILSLRFFAP